jgi:flagellar basal body P-ring formation protein FlgA
MSPRQRSNSKRRLGALAAVLSLAASAAAAGQPVSLREFPSSGPQVTLGDLFEGAGAASRVVVGNGAPLGLSAVLDAGEVQRLAHIHGLDWENPRGVRRIIVPSVAAPAGSAAEDAAPARRMVEALTYAHSLNAGDMVQPQDLTYAKVAGFSVPADAPSDAARVIGKVARRPLRAGAAVSSQDVAAAQVIKRDDVVEIAYRDDGINLILQGRAMGSASAGEPVSVMNPASKKVFQAIAIGPDQAIVGPEAERIRAASLVNPNLYASR